jgi:hypothetical protein
MQLVVMVEVPMFPLQEAMALQTLATVVTVATAQAVLADQVLSLLDMQFKDK